jgi:hypothetical protein
MNVHVSPRVSEHSSPFLRTPFTFADVRIWHIATMESGRAAMALAAIRQELRPTLLRDIALRPTHSPLINVNNVCIQITPS